MPLARDNTHVVVVVVVVVVCRRRCCLCVSWILILRWVDGDVCYSKFVLVEPQDGQRLLLLGCGHESLGGKAGNVVCVVAVEKSCRQAASWEVIPSQRD
eukprot:5672351-Amphidinium_carterae.1